MASPAAPVEAGTAPPGVASESRMGLAGTVRFFSEHTQGDAGGDGGYSRSLSGGAGAGQEGGTGAGLEGRDTTSRQASYTGAESVVAGRASSQAARDSANTEKKLAPGKRRRVT